VKRNNKSFNSLLIIVSLVCLIFSSSFTGYIPATSSSGAIFPNASPVSSLPTISRFVHTLDLTTANTLTGIYIPDTFAYGVVQQPLSAPGYVSDDNNVLTQFRMADDYGTTGLLAHNHLAGINFSSVLPGQTIVTVQGDGSLEYFHVYAVERYQAVSPNSPYSNFRSLDYSSTDISATQLFMHVYAQPGNLVLQTCIANGDEPSWGRLFILAEPISEFVPLPVPAEPGCAGLPNLQLQFQ